MAVAQQARHAQASVQASAEPRRQAPRDFAGRAWDAAGRAADPKIVLRLSVVGRAGTILQLHRHLKPLHAGTASDMSGAARGSCFARRADGESARCQPPIAFSNKKHSSSLIITIIGWLNLHLTSPSQLFGDTNITMTGETTPTRELSTGSPQNLPLFQSLAEKSPNSSPRDSNP